MSNIDVIRTPDIIAAEINGIKDQTRTIMLCNSIEIGRRLTEAKGMLEHGQWADWLKGKVDYSQRTASNLMRLFDEFGAGQITLFGATAKSQAIANLSYTQAVALLGVPEEEREAFIEEHDVESKSVRELQQLIKERDELKAKYDSSQSAVTRLTEERDQFKKQNIDMSFEVSSAKTELSNRDKTVSILREELEKERARTASEVERLVGLLEEERASGSPEKVAELEKKLDEAQQQIVDLNKKINEPVTLEPAVIEKIPPEVEAELEELRRKTAELASRASGLSPAEAAVMKFRIHFDGLVSGFNVLLAALDEIRRVDPDAAAKYETAVQRLIGRMGGQLGSEADAA